MRGIDRRLSAVALLVIVAVAVLGYLAGHARTGAASSSERERTASADHVLLNYPAGWQPAAAVAGIPGLQIAHAIALAPGGDAARAGLLAGQLPTGEPGPLPRQFVARMRGLGTIAVVNLLEVPAYRYAGLSIPGFARALTLYAIPNPEGNPTVLACYASAAHSSFMRACEQIVATVNLVGQSQTYDLTPDPGYARALSASIGALDGQRVALRREMRTPAAPAIVQRLATRLAAGFADSAGALSKLEPAPVAKQAQATLSGSLLKARGTYTALAAAAQAKSPARAVEERKRVYEAETSVDAALETFALLGYRQK
jgi:hypothetical protein